MSELRKKCKAEAKKKLSGKWGVAIGILLIAAVLSSVIGSVTSIPEDLLGNTVLDVAKQVNVDLGDPIGKMAQEFDSAARTPENQVDPEFLEVIPDYFKVLMGYGEGLYEEGDTRLVNYFVTLLDPATWMPSFRIIVGLAVAILAAALIAFFLRCALELGRGKVFYQISVGEGKVGDLFYYFTSFGRFFKAVGMLILIALIETLIGLVGILLMGIGIWLATFFALMEISEIASVISFAVFYALGLFLILAACLRLEMVPYLFFRYPERKNGEIIAESWSLSMGHRWELVVFQLSYLGWSILSLFTFGLLQFYTVPYEAVAYELLMHDIFEKEKMNGKGNPLFALPVEEPAESGVADWDGLNHLDEIKLPEGDDESKYSSEG